MVPRKQGLIVNISSFGGIFYLFNVPYGVGKVGVNKSMTIAFYLQVQDMSQFVK